MREDERKEREDGEWSCMRYTTLRICDIYPFAFISFYVILCWPNGGHRGELLLSTNLFSFIG